MKRASAYMAAGYPVHFTGPSGVGKTTLALNLAKKRNRPVMLMHGNHELSNADLIGSFTGYTATKVEDNYIRSVYKKEENVSETWKNGRLLEAVKNGYTLVYDEFTRSKPSANNLFLSILEEKVLPLYGTKHTEPFIKVHPEFSVIFTSNPEEYAGVYQTQEALLDRLITLPLSFLDLESETQIISSRTGAGEEEAKDISELVRGLREQCRKKGKEGPSLRASIMIAQLALAQNIEISGKNEEFQNLCRDIVWYQMRKAFEKESDSKILDMILSESKKVQG
ncbi:gas vesicle protein GvpN [Bacillus mangrovi]|uniref:Gas vesicle protein GvpN n=2 Tax=Metabacillus mangrovi TaxID=1491830 RepID=A0A7X2S789_9BACI|nr:gas vesicle protein GvpN [Metabacillus mangrovi]